MVCNRFCRFREVCEFAGFLEYVYFAETYWLLGLMYLRVFHLFLGVFAGFSRCFEVGCLAVC